MEKISKERICFMVGSFLIVFCAALFMNVSELAQNNAEIREEIAEIKEEIIEEKQTNQEKKEKIEEMNNNIEKMKKEVEEKEADIKKVKSEKEEIEAELEAEKREVEQLASRGERVTTMKAEITAYAPLCPQAKAGWDYCGDPSVTASGDRVEPGRTIAAPERFPFGTEVKINGKWYEVQDRGGAIVGNKLDVAVHSTDEALEWGRRTKEVKIRY